MSKTKISSKGQTVIPKELRERYNLKKGTVVEWEPYGANAILIRQVASQRKMSWTEWADAWRALPNEIWKGVDPVEHVKQQRRRSSDR